MRCRRPPRRAAREKLQMVFQDPYGSLNRAAPVLRTVSLRMLERAPRPPSSNHVPPKLRAVPA